MNDTDVLIVGAGPTGLTLAASLLLKGVKVTLVDRQAEGANTSRAAGVNARTLEVLEAIDVTRRLVKEGIEAPRFTIRDRAKKLLTVDFSGLATDYRFTLMVPQSTTERLLLERVRELGGDVVRPKLLAALAQDTAGVTATFDDGDAVRARYLVGADPLADRPQRSQFLGDHVGSHARAAVRAAGVPETQHSQYERALAALADAEVLTCA